MKKIAIVTDSNSGISAEDAKKYEIHVLPMIFYVDGQEGWEVLTWAPRFKASKNSFSVREIPSRHS